LVEELLSHLPLADGVGQFEKTVGECGLTVIDVSDDAKVPDVALVHSETILAYGGDLLKQAKIRSPPALLKGSFA